MYHHILRGRCGVHVVAESEKEEVGDCRLYVVH